MEQRKCRKCGNLLPDNYPFHICASCSGGQQDNPQPTSLNSDDIKAIHPKPMEKIPPFERTYYETDWLQIHALMYEGINDIPQLTPLTLTLRGDLKKIVIEPKSRTLSPKFLDISKISSIAVSYKTETVHVNKSAGGRALLGGALFGAAGALAGAASGLNNQQTSNKAYIVINYVSGGAAKQLTFARSSLNFIAEKKFVDRVHQLASSNHLTTDEL